MLHSGTFYKFIDSRTFHLFNFYACSVFAPLLQQPRALKKRKDGLQLLKTIKKCHNRFRRCGDVRLGESYQVELARASFVSNGATP